MNRPMVPENKNKPFHLFVIIGLIVFVVLIVLSGKILGAIGQWLVLDEKSVRSDVVLVLNTGAGWFLALWKQLFFTKRGFQGKLL